MPINSLHPPIALHTWTLDSTPLPDALRIARDAGYDGVELRYLDFMHCREAGMSEQGMVELVRAAGIPVAVIGTENGALYQSGAEQQRLLGCLRYVCEKAVALDCGVVMMPPGTIAADGAASPAGNLRICADIAAGHGLKLALEFSSRHAILNTLQAGLELVDAADRENCGLLFDTYHLHSRGGDAAALRKVPVQRIASFQFSDVPPGPPTGQQVPIDRLPPGKGVVPFVEIFRALMALGYRGPMSYEAPNPAQWSRPPEEVAREGLDLVRGLLAQAAQTR